MAARQVLLGALIILGLLQLTGCAMFGPPSPDDVIEEFRDEDLPLGEVYPVEEVEGWMESPVPKTYEEGMHFDVSMLETGRGGQVFVFEEEEDLQVMEDYYRNLEEMPILGPSLHSHLYRNDLLLLQINGSLPKAEADKYGEVLEGL